MTYIDDKLKDLRKQLDDAKSWEGSKFGSLDESYDNVEFIINEEGIIEYFTKALQDMEKHTLDRVKEVIPEEREYQEYCYEYDENGEVTTGVEPIKEGIAYNQCRSEVLNNINNLYENTTREDTGNKK